MENLHGPWRTHLRTPPGDIGTDDGFTLIEVMIVLVILAILLAIAVPLYLGVTANAGNRAAQSDLNLALKEARTYFDGNGQTYGTGSSNASTVVAGAIASGEPSLVVTTTAVSQASATNSVSVYASSDGSGIVLTSWSTSHWCWVLADNVRTVDTTTGSGDNAPYASGGVPVSAGTWFGKVAAASASSCGSDQALATSYQSGGFPG